MDPKRGCHATSPLSCKSRQQHRFLKLENVSYFISPSFWKPTTVESCKKSCLGNCSCKAALFSHDSDSCYLLTEVFSLREVSGSQTNSTAYIKVQSSPKAQISFEVQSSSKVPLMVGVSIGAVIAVLLVILGISILVYRKKRRTREEGDRDESFLRELDSKPRRFSYEELITMTNNFATKLGSGAFGSVYEGTLEGETSIAVKKLKSGGKGKLENGEEKKKSFVAEVRTIGNIHHRYLVRLIGYCVDKLDKLLVYEYMSNGSLDKWIFEKSDRPKLSWETRRNIIRHVASGLLYLHEGCRKKIVHFDIKPANILLDSKFKAKIADFGLAKLIDRDQSDVQTRAGGTPGYLAPELISSAPITVKADVYSFGVVILETVCLRKISDISQSEQPVELLKKMAMSGKLLDLLDKRERDVQSDAEEMVDMLKLAIRCLDHDTKKRPSMSMVVEELPKEQGIPEDFNDASQENKPQPELRATSSTMSESILSGSR